MRKRKTEAEVRNEIGNLISLGVVLLFLIFNLPEIVGGAIIVGGFYYAITAVIGLMPFSPIALILIGILGAIFGGFFAIVKHNSRH